VSRNSKRKRNPERQRQIAKERAEFDEMTTKEKIAKNSKKAPFKIDKGVSKSKKDTN
jgi:hypothetical protein